MANEPLNVVVPEPAKTTPPKPGEPITVFGPMASGSSPEPSFVIVRFCALGNSRLPVPMLARLIIAVPLVPDDTVMALTPVSDTPAFELNE